MPSFKMKTKLSTGCLREKNGLLVCQKSRVISKKACSPNRISQRTVEFNTCVQNCEDVSSSTEISTGDIESYESVDHKELLDEENFQFQKESSFFVDSAIMGGMEATHTCSSNLETIFSPVLEPIEDLGEPNFDNDADSNNDFDVPRLGPDDRDDNIISSDYQTCNVSDFYISDMIIASLPFDGNAVEDDFTRTNHLIDDKGAESSMLFDMAEQYMILPYLKDTVKTSDTNDDKPCKETTMHADNSGLYLAIHQMSSCNQESDVNSFSDSDQTECFDPHSFIRTLPELSDVDSNFRPNIFPKEAQKEKSITLVLDLDETLVHSTLEPCDDADFTFTVFFNLKEHTVYVKQRPYVQPFLEKVAEMFEVVIFTASQSIYAEQLLDILDPDRKLISRRAYRESCIFSDGSYTKDLTILGVDLAKIAIIDNSPQVFRLQVNNGIPIKSWFDDPLDCALLSLLPFLETLVDSDDVRPIIAKRFGNKE